MNSTRPGLANLRITVDTVILTIVDESLKVLLVKRDSPPFEGQLVLPGGYMWDGETSTETAERVLRDKTKVSGVFVEQLYTFDSLDRDPRERVISIAYFALVPAKSMANLPSSVSLLDVYDIGDLGFDHLEMVKMAVDRTKSKLEYTNAAYSLLPKRFTLSELQAIYETILNQKLDKRNFRKKILSLGMIKETNEMQTGKKHRPARLYSFRKQTKQSFDSPFVWL